MIFLSKWLILHTLLNFANNNVKLQAEVIMISTLNIKNYVLKLYKRLEILLSKEINEDDNLKWINDNKNRILAINSALVLSAPACYLKKGYKQPKALELAREITKQTKGNINEETLEILSKFHLSFEEYDLIPLFFKITLLEMIEDVLLKKESADFAPFTVKSLILFDHIDFSAFREKCLKQEQLLLKNADFEHSDEQTKAEYRKRISRLSFLSNLSETEICEKLNEQAGTITENLFLNKELFNLKIGVTEKEPTVNLKLFLYILSGVGLSLFFILLIWFLPASILLKISLSIASFCPFLVFFINVINRSILFRSTPPQPMRLKKEFADTLENKTAIVLTILLENEKTVKKALKTIEEYYFANYLDNGTYLILGDLFESETAFNKSDEKIISLLKQGVKELNEKYDNRFSAILRLREKRDNKYSGWERKRGAIEQLVNYIVNNQENAFILNENVKQLQNVKYICTLDADTVMPPESVVKLLGVIAHPKNKNYSLVQAGIGSTLKNETTFSKIMASMGGIDAYNYPIGEVNNDFFLSGTFCGKGIFSVDAYNKKVSGVIQPNTVLSHDLLEGELLNTIEANDVTFLDDFPKTPISYYKRRERWIRGDWQLVPWLFSSLKPVSKWKIFYNLVQSLFSAGIFLQVLLAPFFSLWAFLIWGVCVIELSMPTIFAYLDALKFDTTKHAFLDNRPNRKNSLKRSLINKMFLPYECCSGLLSAFKGLWRRFVSHKKILEWSTFSSTQKNSGIKEYFLFFSSSIILGALFFYTCIYNGIGIIIGFLAFVCWGVSPFVAYNLGLKIKQNQAPLLPEETYSLKLLFMRTLRFFFDALKENDNIIPDNLQLKPYKGYAKRTSPTNIGFALLSTVCGLKSGAYSPTLFANGLLNQIEKIKSLPKYKGHLYNWYNTETGEILDSYVSTVDSGNFCASLIAIKGAFDLARDRKILQKTECNGIGDAICSLLDAVPNDFKSHLEEYANDFYLLSGKKARNRAEDFLNEGILSTCSDIDFCQQIIKDWVQDYDGLSFSDKIFDKIEKTGEFNLRPLKEYLQTFPHSIKETLEINDFEEKLDSLVWSAGREKYADILMNARNEFRKIYGYAYLLNEKFKEIESFIDDYLENIDFTCIFDQNKKLLNIGLNAKTNKKSGNCYDMLMSEARLTSFVGIALNKLPAEHWFKLSRQYARIDNKPLCLSWSGTMFEYLMPDIFIKPSKDSMLYNSAFLQVLKQMEYKSKNGIWGISESAFNNLDRSREYSYKAFGIPVSAISSFKAEKVFSPYSTILSMEYNPRECMDNIIRLVENGVMGKFGFYEAIDYKRLKGESGAVVCSHMAHHSGMSLCALTNYFYDGFIRKAFLKSNYISASKVLLDEKMPIGVLPRKKTDKEESVKITESEEFIKQFIYPQKQSTQMLVLSAGEIRVEATSKGKLKIFNGSTFIGEGYLYLKNEKTSSVSYEPVRDLTNEYQTIFKPESACYISKDKFLEAKFSVYPIEDTSEILLSVTLNNKTEELKTEKIVFALDIALNTLENYQAHPYFNGLSVEAKECENAIEMHNKKTGQKCILSVLNGENVRFQTDKSEFIGRNNDFTKPKLNFDTTFKHYPITPVMSVETEVLLNGGEQKETCLILSFNEPIIKNIATVNLKKETASLYAKGDISAFNIKKEEWLLSLKIASLKEAGIRAKGNMSLPETLWQYSINDKIPIMLVFVPKDYIKERLVTLLKSVKILMDKGFCMQVVLIEDSSFDYLDEAYNSTAKIIDSIVLQGTVHHLKKSIIKEEDLNELISVSFLSFNLEDELETIKKCEPIVETDNIIVQENKYPLSKNDLIDGEFDSGFGRFINDGKEYYIYGQTPMPWSNVIANKNFGTLITESGGGYTFYKNSCLNKLTPWYNDAISDTVGEGLYLRDNQNNKYWSITRNPVHSIDEKDIIFGKGYGVYRYNGYGLNQKQTVFVHKDKPIKVINVSLENLENRDISAFFFAKIVLGQNLQANKHVKVEEKYGLLCAQTSNRYMFIYADNAEYCASFTGFFGNGGLKDPDCIKQGYFIKSEDIRPNLALKIKATKDFNVFLGAAESEEELKEISEFLKNAKTDIWLEEVKESWEEKTNAIKIRTPDRKLDILFNNWLYYQTVSSRILARCGFYQAGGAIGFRDQIQDCLMLMLREPEFVKNHILTCAKHQFKEGDVQHWWHPEFTGVRTLVSDDLLFLPYITGEYILRTGDKSILDISVPFLEGHSLGNREDLYEIAWQSQESATVYEHCVRAIKLTLKRTGKHDLPLILAGDWNDGLNNLGKKGIGESVWLGWFLFSVISLFAPFVKEKDAEFHEQLLEHAKKLVNQLNTSCWDGAWYKRAFDDINREIGSNKSECAKIDAISQAWSVISGAGKSEFTKTAMESLEKYLIDYQGNLVKLLTPPFTKEYNAGYIGDYIPGVRENGGQYTHGAIWSAQAFFRMGECEKGAKIIDMINPISHTLNKSATKQYKIEPYVLAADIYSNVENYGRGGWSWYTASSALYYDVILSDMLGVKQENGELKIEPHIPSAWNEYSVKIETDKVKTEIKVLNPENKSDTVTSVNVKEKENESEIRVVM